MALTSAAAKTWWVDHAPSGVGEAAYDVTYFQVALTKAQINALFTTAVTLLPATTAFLWVPEWVHFEFPAEASASAYGAGGAIQIKTGNTPTICGSAPATLLTSAPPQTYFQPICSTAAGAVPAAFVTADFNKALTIQALTADFTGGAGFLYVSGRVRKIPAQRASLFLPTS